MPALHTLENDFICHACVSDNVCSSLSLSISVLLCIMMMQERREREKRTIFRLRSERVRLQIGQRDRFHPRNRSADSLDYISYERKRAFLLAFTSRELPARNRLGIGNITRRSLRFFHGTACERRDDWVARRSHFSRAVLHRRWWTRDTAADSRA